MKAMIASLENHRSVMLLVGDDKGVVTMMRGSLYDLAHMLLSAESELMREANRIKESN